MRKIVVVLSTVFISITVALATEISTDTGTSQSTEIKEQNLSHSVIKGDTLWDISGKYYQNPWNWPRIWEANKLQIKNPHWIYPEQVFVIPDKSAPVTLPIDTPAVNEEAAVETPQEQVEETIPEQKPEEVVKEPVSEEVSETQEAVQEPEPETEPEQVSVPETKVSEEKKNEETSALEKAENIKKYFQEKSFIVPESWEGDGLIIGEKEKKFLVSSGDTVYINLGSSKVKPGMHCAVYRKIGRFTDPSTRDYLGIEVKNIGKIKVTNAVSEQTTTCLVISSCEPIEIGDVVTVIQD